MTHEFDGRIVILRLYGACSSCELGEALREIALDPRAHGAGTLIDAREWSARPDGAAWDDLAAEVAAWGVAERYAFAVAPEHQDCERLDGAAAVLQLDLRAFLDLGRALRFVWRLDAHDACYRSSSRRARAHRPTWSAPEWAGSTSTSAGPRAREWPGGCSSESSPRRQRPRA